MGKITRIAGHIIEAKDLENAKMNSKVLIGKQKLIGEIIKLENGKAIIQAFEDTDGLKIDDLITSVGTQITATLGPGLIGSIFDGLQRPLKDMDKFIEKGISKDPLNQKTIWTLKKLKEGKIKKGDIIAEVKETGNITHKIFATDTGIAKIKSGDYTVKDIFGTLKTKEKTIKLTMQTTWPVYTKRPYKEKYTPQDTLITGQRVIDTMFPIAKGGCAAIPGGFGCGKTITTQMIAKFADADIVIMALVGERGNECADVLSSFPKIKDKKTGKSIMERSIIIANTSNMPVSARISSIYLATTIGEYYRDMGLNVLLITDSTSRWAEAIREISGMLEEMPGDEGYPAYLASKISSFYERSGIVKTMNDNNGSLTIMGTVSPPGGDFSEPVVQATKSITRCFWALRSELAYQRHYPAIDWLESYSHYTDDLKLKNDDTYDDWSELRDLLMTILQNEKELEKIVRLVGYDGLADKDKFLLKVAELFRENFLQQNAFHDVDMYCTFNKQYEMLKIFVIYYEMGLLALEHDKELKDILNPTLIEHIAGMKFEKRDEFGALGRKIEETLLGKTNKIDLDDLLDKGE